MCITAESWMQNDTSTGDAGPFCAKCGRSCRRKTVLRRKLPFRCNGVLGDCQDPSVDQ